MPPPAAEQSVDITFAGEVKAMPGWADPAPLLSEQREHFPANWAAPRTGAGDGWFGHWLILGAHYQDWPFTSGEGLPLRARSSLVFRWWRGQVNRATAGLQIRQVAGGDACIWSRATACSCWRFNNDLPEKLCHLIRDRLHTLGRLRQCHDLSIVLHGTTVVLVGPNLDVIDGAIDEDPRTSRPGSFVIIPRTNERTKRTNDDDDDPPTDDDDRRAEIVLRPPRFWRKRRPRQGSPFRDLRQLPRDVRLQCHPFALNELRPSGPSDDRSCPDRTADTFRSMRVPRTRSGRCRPAFYVFAVTALGCVTLAPLATTPSGAQGTWAITDEADSYIAYYTGIACPSPSECLAVSSGNNGSIVATETGGSSWERVDTFPSGADLDGIACPTTQECFGVGYSTGNVAAPEIFATTDAADEGGQWSSQTVPASVESLAAISCADEDSCWAVGSGTNAGDVIIATTDAGQSWSAQAVPADVQVSAIACTNDQDCWAVGRQTDLPNDGAILATTDGGEDWSDAPTELDTSDDTFGALAAITCVAPSTCFAVGQATALATTDGTDWAASQPLPTDAQSLNSVSCVSASDCWAAGGSQAVGSVISTSDGGTTWSDAQTTGTTGELSGVSCPLDEVGNPTGDPAQQECWVVGAEPTTGEVVGQIAETTDGGFSWTVEDDIPSTNFKGVTCATEESNYCWAYGNQDRTTPILLASTDAGATWQVDGSLPSSVTDVDNMMCFTSSDCLLEFGTSTVGDAGLLLTDDGGTTWQSEDESPTFTTCPNADECWAASGSQGLLLSTDGGLQWSADDDLQPVPGVTPADYGPWWETVACANADDCWAGGEYEVERDNPYYVPVVEATTDGGVEWSQPETLPAGLIQTGSAVTGMSCPTAEVCLATTDALGSDVAAVTTDGGTTWTEETLPSTGSISCPSASECWEVSSSYPGGQVWQLALAAGGGITASLASLPLGVARVSSLDCSADAACLAAGSADNSEAVLVAGTAVSAPPATTTTAPPATTTTAPPATTTTVAAPPPGGGSPGGGSPGLPSPPTTTIGGPTTTTAGPATTTTTTTATTAATTTTTLPARLPPGTPGYTYGTPVTEHVSLSGANLFEAANGAQATVEVPGGALPEGSEVSLAAVISAPALNAKLPAGQSYLVAFDVSWAAPNGSSPSAKSPLTIVVKDPAIKAGDIIYLVTTQGPKAVGVATSNGTVTVTFTTDPDFLIANVARISIAAPTARLVGSRIQVRLGCTKAVACSGSGSLSVRSGKAASAHSIVLAEGHFRVPAGKSELVGFEETTQGSAYFATGRAKSAGLLTITLVGGKKTVHPVSLP
jgi:hypothetical protein